MVAGVKRYFALDLETVPDEDLVSAVDGDSSRTYADKLRKVLAARRAQSGGRSDFLPIPYHRPVVACGLEAEERDGALVVTDLFNWTDRISSETHFLLRIWDKLKGRTLVTFHGNGFDLPVLQLRSLKLGLSVPASAIPWVPGDHDDLFYLLSNGNRSPSASLDLYAKLVGLPGKEEVAGKDVLNLYTKDDLRRLSVYCMSDVIQTWLLYTRFQLVRGALSTAGYRKTIASLRDRLPTLFAERLEQEVSGQLEAFLGRCTPFLEGSPAPTDQEGALPVAV